jgi:2-furoyl-CoA dehydrogenase large subunit
LLREGLRFVTGSGLFIDDITLPRMAHLVFVRSPYAHAKINRVDVSEALRMPGVLAVVDGRQVASACRPIQTFIDKIRYFGIAVEKARFYGEPVAMVAATSLEAAYDAAENIHVEYEPLPAVIDPSEAGKGAVIHESLGSNKVLSKTFTFGDVEKAFNEANKVVKEKFIFERYSAAPLEPCGVVADYRADGSLTVYDNQQTPQLFRRAISAALGIPYERTRFIEPDVGGGFGVKIMLYPYVVLVSYMSKLLGRPVKWFESRREHLAAMAHNSNRVIDVEMAFRSDGRVLGYKTFFIEDCGAYVRPPDPGGVIRSLMTYTGCYDIRNVQVGLEVVVTNKCPTGPVRGYGCQHAYFALERTMDIAARELNLKPEEIRRINLVKEQPYKTVFGSVYDGGNYEDVLDKALKLAEVEKYRNRPYTGVGLACVVEPAVTNLARNRLLFSNLKTSGSAEGAVVKLNEMGEVVAIVASIPNGQGHETVAAEVVANTLGVSPEKVRVLHGDTDIVYPSPYGGTWGSRFSVMTAAAVKKACERLREKIIKISSALLEAAPEDLEIVDGSVHVRGSNVSITFAELAAKVYRDTTALKNLDTSLYAECFYDFPNFGTGGPGEFNMSATYGNSAHVAVVEVDPETYEVRILRYVAVHDCGKILNKEIVEGQIFGGVVQGIGATLYEKIAYDDNGVLLTTSFADYLLPTAVEAPEILIDHVETPSMFSELGSKGMGEGPMIPVAAALANAIDDALKIGIKSSHIHPSQLWKSAASKT